MARALLYDRFGGIDELYVGELPELTLEPGHVRIQTKAAALNPFDFKMRSGLIPIQVTFPHGVGNDFSGVVSEVAPGATYFNGEQVRVGDDVLGFADQNAVAEEIVLSASQIAKKPHNVSWSVAGGLAVAGLTAQACIDALQISSVDVIAVSAAAGGVGQVFCQLAREHGAKVVGIAGPNNQQSLRDLGVNPVDYNGELVEQLRVAAPEGFTKFLDCFGRSSIDLALSLGIPASQLCSIVDHAAVAELELATPGRYERSAATLAELANKVSSGSVTLKVQETFTLDQYSAAFELLERRHLHGKVVITF